MNSKPIQVFAKWQVKEGNLDTVLPLLQEAAEKSREEAGNLFYRINQSTTDANLIVLHEGYTNEAAINEHRNTKHFQEIVVAKIVPLLENREVIVTTAISE